MQVGTKLALEAPCSPFTQLVYKMIGKLDFEKPPGLDATVQRGLPPWLTQPQVDSAHWLNNMLAMLWPIVNKLAIDWINKKNTLGSYNTAVNMRQLLDLQFHMDLGKLPMVLVDGIKVPLTWDQLAYASC